MLGFLSRLSKPAERVHAVAGRPLWILQSRRPALTARLWDSPYCCTMVYFWFAVVTEEQCRNSHSEADKQKILQKALARTVAELDGAPAKVMQQVLPEGHPRRLRALTDLKRAVDLMRKGEDSRLMIYDEYRTAIEADGRPALSGNRWGLGSEAAHEILIARYLAANVPVDLNAG